VRVTRARKKTGDGRKATRRQIARGVFVERPELTAGGWRVQTYGPLYGPVYVGRHRGERRAERRAGKHRRQR
jgi:hypothetical protein